MSPAEALAHRLWSAESESKDADVGGKRRKDVWIELIAEIRRLEVGQRTIGLGIDPTGTVPP